MNFEDIYQGSKWIKCDFHLHSPGVHTFKLPNGFNIENEEDVEKLSELYVEELKKANIKIGAITDYNIIRKIWFEKIRDKAKEKGIVILPGVELSIALGKYGIHILVILDDNENFDIEGFNRFIHSLDKNPQEPLVNGRKHREIDSKFALEELIKEIRLRYNCLIVFAHPEDDDKGLLKSFSTKEATKYLAAISPDALEYTSKESVYRLISTGEIDKYTLLKIPIIENSDPKSLKEIGTKERDGKIRCTYLKISDYNLDAIRVALLEPFLRVRLYNSPEYNYTKITKLKISGTTFLKDIEIDFSPELNTFIGGRGVGKSSIIEAIRYCLNLPYYSEEVEQRLSFIENVVGSGGEITLFIDKYLGNKKTSYTISRIFGKHPEIKDEQGVTHKIEPLNLFDKNKSPFLIGQKELYFISQDEKFLLQLIDQFIGDKIINKQKELETEISKLKENANDILELEKKLEKKDEYEQELNNIKSKINEFEKLGVLEKYERYTKIIEDDEILTNAKDRLQQLLQDFDDEVKNLIDGLLEISSSLKLTKSEKKEILNQFSFIIDELTEYFKKIDANKYFNENYNQKWITLWKNWEEAKKSIENEIDGIKKKLGEERLQPERLEELTKRKTRIESLVKTFNKIENDLKKLNKERNQIKGKLTKIRHELFQLRKDELAKLNKILNGKLKVSIIYEGERKLFRQQLSNILFGSGIHKSAIENLVNSPNVTIDGLLLSEKIQEGPTEISNTFKLTDKMSEKLCEHFSDKSKLFDLETLMPEDLIKIELNIDNKFISLDKLSPGQKATALLLLLFAMEDRILILDQPEEDLDNRFIYEDVVRLLNELKGNRQILIATHNANIPVLGDSELVIVLEKENDICKIVDLGSVDKNSIKENVKKIMEGGEEAFKRRAEKYGVKL